MSDGAQLVGVTSKALVRDMWIVYANWASGGCEEGSVTGRGRRTADVATWRYPQTWSAGGGRRGLPHC